MIVHRLLRRADPAGRFLAAAFAAALICAVAHAQAPEPSENEAVAIEETLAIADRLILTGRPVDAFAVLIQTMDSLPEGTDTAPLRFAIAQALMAGGRLSQAEQVLARLEEEHPDNLRVRLDRGLLLFTLGRDDEASDLFREVRRVPDLPPYARRKVEGLLARILDRQRLRIDLDIGLWRDNNVNGAAEVETVQIPAFGNLEFKLDEQPVRAWVARTGAKLRWREPVTEDGRLLVETNVSAARNTAVGASEHNRTWLSLSTGPRLGYAVTLAGRPRPGRVGADVGVERRLRGGNGYATGVWGGLSLEQSINANWHAGVFPRVWTTRYDGQGSDTDSMGGSLGAYLSRSFGPGWLTLDGTLARETAKLRGLRWSSRGLGLRYAVNLGENMSGSLRLGLSAARFDEEDAVFLARREDQTRTAGMTLSHRKLSWEGYLPVLTLEWSRTDSSIPLYDRNSRTVRIGLRRLF